MRWFEHLQKITALLSRIYLMMVLCLGTWAVLPLAIGWTPTVVMSGSMLPNVEIGDVVVAQNLTLEQKKELIAPGHVLLATDPSHPEKLVTHRVVNVIEGSGFITKGDANATADPTIVPIANVHGIERLRIPMIGIPIQSSRVGNFIPTIIFTVVTVLAQFLVLHDMKHDRKTSNSASPIKEIKEPRKKGRHRARKSAKTMVLRLICINLTFACTLVLSISLASSAASFSGIASDKDNNFNAMADFAEAYKTGILAESPFSYYRFNDISGPTASDSSGNERLATYSDSGISYQASGALQRDSSNEAITLDGTQGMVTSSAATAGLQSMTTQIWFKTTSTEGGKLVGFAVGTSDSALTDRVLYMAPQGNIVFGIDSATKKTIQTPNSYNDGNWHMVAVTLSGLDAVLYIDGEKVASGTTTSAPTDSSGYWLIGGGNFTEWATIPNFSGSLDEVAIYTKPLTPARILSQFGAA
jgi:signal peptidase I